MKTPASFALNTTVEIPAVGYGTYLIAEADAPSAVCNAISAGYRHIDTASGYRNETGVGEGIRQGIKKYALTRSDMFVTAKLWPGNAEWGDAPKGRQEVIAECDATLSRLGLDYVDLYLIHAPYGEEKRLEQWETMLTLKRDGKARAVGVSNFNCLHLEEIEAAGMAAPDANQIELHPWSQKHDLLASMSARGITPIAYSSLVPLSTWRVEEGQESAKTAQMVADGVTFDEMAERYGVTTAQLLLRWGIQNGYAVIPKSMNIDRMRLNLDLFSFSIDAEDMDTMRGMDRGEGVAWATGDPSR